jgi:transposase
VVGIETHHSLLVDYLVEQGYGSIYVLPPNTVKSAQGRYRQSGARSDPKDAHLIADMLRTDGDKYVKWVPDAPLTRQIRAKVSLINFLGKQIWQSANRLRAALLRYYPVALELFSTLDSPVTLTWIEAFPTPQEGQALSYSDFEAFLHRQQHRRSSKWAASYAKLQTVQATATAEISQVYAQEAQFLARVMKDLVQSRKRILKEVYQAFLQHPDCAIYQSLPAAGEFLEPALLAMLGDNRQRFPTQAVMQALAGTCPVTEQSGKSRYVKFRRSCDHEFRQIVQQWARLSTRRSPWAAGYYQMVRPHCRSENEAYRKLANRWLEILWRLWQDRQPYDEQRHLSAHARRSLPRP